MTPRRDPSLASESTRSTGARQRHGQQTVIWQEAHSESIDGDLDDEKWDSIQNHGVIRAIEQIDNIARDANELLLVTTEGRRATRESTAEMRGGSWRARFQVELRQPD